MRVLDTGMLARGRGVLAGKVGAADSVDDLSDIINTAGFYLPAFKVEHLYQSTDTSTPVVSDADPVGRLDDQSGNGYAFTQGTAANRPAWNAAGGYIQFDGVNDLLANAEDVNTNLAAGSFTLALAVRADALNFDTVWWANEIFIGDVGGYFGVYGRSTGKIGASINVATIEADYTIGNDVVVIVKYDGANLTLGLDGVDETPASGAFTSAATNLQLMKAYSANHMQGRIYSAFWSNHVVSAGEEARILAEMARQQGRSL